MKRYTMSAADSLKHIPEHPDRTAFRGSGWDVVYQVWPNKESMRKTISMQQSRASHHTDWQAWEDSNIAFMALRKNKAEGR